MMKDKFETNVASKTPKENKAEPSLPWQVKAKEIEKLSAGQQGFKADNITAPPLKTPASLLVLVLIAVFVVTIAFVSFVKMENERAKDQIKKKEEAVSSLETGIARLKDEKKTIDSSLAQMEKRIGELIAQKELFANVLDGLAKTSDDSAFKSDAQSKDEIASSRPEQD